MSGLITTAENPSFNYSERVKELKERVADYKKKISFTDKTDLSLIGYKTAHADCKNKMIALPSWILLKYEDIPARFLIDDVNDPRLFNESFLDEFAAWIDEKLKDSGLFLRRPDSSTGLLQKLILLLRDRDLFEKSKDFILGHELGHMVYNNERKFSLGVITAGIIALCLSLLAIPFLNLFVGLIGAGIAIVILSAGIRRLPSLSPVEQEKQADCEALSKLKDARGGIYYFDTELKVNQRLHSLGEPDFDANGNRLHNTTHPALTDRLDYLSRWQKEWPQAKAPKPTLLPTRSL